MFSLGIVGFAVVYTVGGTGPMVRRTIHTVRVMQRSIDERAQRESIDAHSSMRGTYLQVVEVCAKDQKGRLIASGIVTKMLKGRQKPGSIEGGGKLDHEHNKGHHKAATSAQYVVPAQSHAAIAPPVVQRRQVGSADTG
eukprot:1195101-Prorocentrum_minimum.AAC.2